MVNGARAVILAGGQGARFWPISRALRPKQFLSISGNGESLLQATARRIEPLVGRDNVSIISTPPLVPLIKEHVPWSKLIIEPSPKNTAACIGLAATAVALENPSTVMVVLPADHAVSDEESLRGVLDEAVQMARAERILVTIGVTPNSPHTGYGYIKRGKKVKGSTFKVDRFFEKPSLERARKYCESREYSWNSGMFVWQAGAILEAIAEYLPECAAVLGKIGDVLRKNGLDALQGEEIAELYSSIESISIDFGVLEHARNTYVVQAESFGWNDVGSWDAWAEHFDKDGEGNLVHGDALLFGSQGCVVQSHSRFVAVVGATDLMVIDSGDALLVCTRESVQDVRKVVDALKQRGRKELV